MSDIPTEDFEHTEHAHHASRSGEPFIVKVTVTVALLAVIAATIASFETMESGLAIGAKNDSVLHQNRATDTWGFFQARSIKKNLYEIAAASNPVKSAEFLEKAKQYEAENAEIQKKAEALEGRSEEALRSAELHERRHHVLTVAATLLHISIAIATIAIVAHGRRWPWYAAMGLGGIGSLIAIETYLV